MISKILAIIIIACIVAFIGVLYYWALTANVTLAWKIYILCIMTFAIASFGLLVLNKEED